MESVTSKSCQSFEINSDNALNDLQACLDEISRPHEGAEEEDSTPPYMFTLHLYEVHFTPTILALLVQVLNQPLYQDMVPSTATAPRKWDHVEFHDCRLTRPEGNGRRRTPSSASVEYCSREHMDLLGAAVARQISRTLNLSESPMILECLFGSLQPLEVATLCLDQADLSAVECEQLGDLIQRSAALKNLMMVLTHLDRPQPLVESLAQAIHLEELSIRGKDRYYFDHERPQNRRDIITKQGGIDMAVRLVQNPQSRLQKLTINDMYLGDHDFMAIAEALPTSQLVSLDVSHNSFQCPGILALAKQLPRIKCLETVRLYGNPSENEQEGYEECCEALLQGMRENHSIEYFRTPWESRPLQSKLGFYCNLNRAGRRILATPESIPIGLWAFILERAGRNIYRCSEFMDDWDLCDRQFRSEAIFFFLQNSPVLSILCSSSFLKNSPRKKSRMQPRQECAREN